MSQSKISPIEVSWEISRTIPLMKLEYEEGSIPTLLFAGNIHTRTASQNEIVRKEIRISFDWVLWIKQQLAISQQQVISILNYDWSEVEAEYRLDASVSIEDLRRQRLVWLNSALLNKQGILLR